jgi:hypothetical protein
MGKTTNLAGINILPWRKRNGPDCSRKSQRRAENMKKKRKKGKRKRRARNAPSSSLEASIPSGIRNQ